MAKTRGVSTTQPLPVKTRSSRQALKEKTNTLRNRAPLYEDDGNTEDLVKDAKPQRGQRRRIIQPEHDNVMAGGLGLGSEVGDENEDPILPVVTRNRMPPTKEPGTLQTTNKPGRRPRTVRKIIPDEAQQQMLAGMKKRMETTAKAQKSQRASDDLEVAQVADPDDVADKPYMVSTARQIESISPSPPPPGQDSPMRGARSSMILPGSVLKLHGTPAMESSIMALKNFKRRPRQPSMLQMVQQRTTSARPSVIHVPSDQESSELDFDLGGADDEDDFAPDAEGTPLKNRNTNRPLSAQKSKLPSPDFMEPTVLSSESGRKRKSNEIGSSSSMLRSRRAKKQRSSSTANQSSLLLAQERSDLQNGQDSDRAVMSPADPALNVEVLHSSPPSSPPYDPLPTARRKSTPEPSILVASPWQNEKQQNSLRKDSVDMLDGTLADPMSSSPMREARQDATVPGKSTISTKNRRPQPSTADLQAKMPKQRRKLAQRQRKTTYDMPSDSEEEILLGTTVLGEDEDELSARIPSRQRASTVTKRTRASKATAVPSKTKVTPKRRTASSSTQKKISKTYGATKSNKEADNGYESPLEDSEESTVPDISLSMHEAAKSQELEEAKRKFAEIDDWDMEFESQSAENHRSSSIGWR